MKPLKIACAVLGPWVFYTFITSLHAAPGFKSVTSKPANAQPKSGAAENARAFTFTYQLDVKDIPAGTRKVRVWIPRPSSDSNQSVVVKKASAPVRLRETREPKFGDRILYAEIPNPKSSNVEFTLEYEITRNEYSKGDYATLMKFNNDPGRLPKPVSYFLLPDHLVPTSGKILTLAQQNTQGKQGPIEKAHALYDYVFRTLRYDKSGTGWGRGDSLWACDAKHGNCTDFHSLFISLARAEKIPARFEIGFPIPRNAHAGEVTGYHCWAEFYVNGAGWIPVDISEAWKDPSKHDYFFGTLDADRVQFSTGRDLQLEPAQDGPPVNYFVYPYVEVDGRPYDKVERKFSFSDHAAEQTAEFAGRQKAGAR